MVAISLKKKYAVSIIIACLTAVGRKAGPVRPPLSDLTDEEMGCLTEIVNGYK